MERLYDVLERAHLCSLNRLHAKHCNRLPLKGANSPAGLLVVKMREMEEGTFVGKVPA